MNREEFGNQHVGQMSFVEFAKFFNASPKEALDALARDYPNTFVATAKSLLNLNESEAQRLLRIQQNGTGAICWEEKELLEKILKYFAKNEAAKTYWEEFRRKQEEEMGAEHGAKAVAGHGSPLSPGGLVGASHNEQVMVLEEHFANGGSYADAALALGCSKEQAARIKKAEKELNEKQRLAFEEIQRQQSAGLMSADEAKQKKVELKREKDEEMQLVIRRVVPEISATLNEAMARAVKNLDMSALKTGEVNQDRRAKLKAKLEQAAHAQHDGVASADQKLMMEAMKLFSMDSKKAKSLVSENPGLATALADAALQNKDSELMMMAMALKSKGVLSEGKMLGRQNERMMEAVSHMQPVDPKLLDVGDLFESAEPAKPKVNLVQINEKLASMRSVGDKAEEKANKELAPAVALASNGS